MKRLDFIKVAALSLLAVGTASHSFEPETLAGDRFPISLSQTESKGPFWPDEARMVFSASMQMEAVQTPGGVFHTER